MRRPVGVLLVSLALLTGCPKHDDSCSQANLKEAVGGLMADWYLYPDLMASIDPRDATYPTVNDYLDAVTKPARDQGMDRYWTYATSYTSTQQYYDAGSAVGFGVGLLVRTDASSVQHLFAAQVYPASPALGAGFARGDEILAIGDGPSTLVDVQTLLANGTLGTALGPSTVGLTRSFSVLTVAGQTVTRTATKAQYGLDPVPGGGTVIPRDGTTPAGYVALRTFINPANPLLQQAFNGFKAAGVTDVVVDLRYNGGGLVSSAELLANLLAGDRSTSDVMFTLRNNPAQSRYDAPTYFDPGCDTSDSTKPPVCTNPIGTPGVPFRIAFITTGATASASELVPNVLEAYHHDTVALVGARTYGKPVGQRAWALPQCDLAVYLVSLKLVNAEGDGDYYQGLPDAAGHFSGCFAQAEDDLTHAMGDPAETSTAAALSWLATGTCPPAPAPAQVQAQAKLWSGTASPSAASAAPAAPDASPESPWPDEAQRNVRGLF